MCTQIELQLIDIQTIDFVFCVALAARAGKLIRHFGIRRFFANVDCITCYAHDNIPFHNQFRIRHEETDFLR